MHVPSLRRAGATLESSLSFLDVSTQLALKAILKGEIFCINFVFVNIIILHRWHKGCKAGRKAGASLSSPTLSHRSKQSPFQESLPPILLLT